MKTKWILLTMFLLAGSFLVAGDGQRVRRGTNQVERLDTDGDGQISKEEFQANSDKQFDKMDANGDGVLTEDELGRRTRSRDRSGKRSERSGKRGKRGEHTGNRGSGRLVLIADADHSLDVTAEEWSTFISAVSAEDGINVDGEKLTALLPERGDRGAEMPQIALEDLQAGFERMDKNDDGQLSEDELPKMRTRRGRMRGALGGMLLLKAADGDDVPGISGEEWSSFLDSLDADDAGVLNVETLAERISEAHGTDGGERRPPFDRILDLDRDGSVEIEDLQAVYARLDKNGDGDITEDELTSPKRRRGNRRGKR